MEPQQARSVESRNRVLHAGRALIEEVGIDRLTLAAVAGRAGVAVGTVYTRFENRDHLIEEVVRVWTVEVTSTFAAERAAAEGLAGPSGGIRALVRLFHANRLLIRQLVIQAPLHAGLAAIVDPWVALERERLVASLVRNGAASARAELVATMALATVERAAVAEAGEQSWVNLEEGLAEICTDLLGRDRPADPS